MTHEEETVRRPRGGGSDEGELPETVRRPRGGGSEADGPHEIALSLGSNCGDRERAIDVAVAWLKTILPRAMACASYETAPVGGGTRAYLNSVMTAETTLTDEALNLLLKEYEKTHGRDDAARARGDVPIDIDLVVSAGRILRPRDYAAEFFRIGFAALFR